MGRAEPREKRPPPSINLFVGLMIAVIAIQGTYLGYVVGMLTSLEKRFGISSEPSGALLSVYDIGHTLAILAIGYFGEKAHQPRITAIGVILSALSMFLLALPAAIFGGVSQDDVHLINNRAGYIKDSECNSNRFPSDEMEDCVRENTEHTAALAILLVGQLLAGVFSAPFNTLAYVYIDNNIEDRRRSPFVLGLLTSMFAFGPALGFGLSAGLNQVYATLGGAPDGLAVEDEEWIGAWWLGFILCGVLYLLVAAPLFFFPQSYQAAEDAVELQSLRHGGAKKPHLPPARFEEEEGEEGETGCGRLKESMRDFPLVVGDLLRNPVYVSMVLGWMFGSYLIAGYGTYLPKYLESQYGRSASAADMYAGIISIGAVASSTAIGGWVLSRSNVGPRSAILLLLFSWVVVALSYLAGMIFACDEPVIQGLEYQEHLEKWKFFDTASSDSCSSHCGCQSVFRFDPVHYDGVNFFSPCHAGCSLYDEFNRQWTDCSCAGGQAVYHGIVHSECTWTLVGYLVTMFIGLFLGNLFFMTTMMIVLRSVYDDQKVTALSFASMITNLLGFIPAPLFLGWLIDGSCTLWRSRCQGAPGNCVIYDNTRFRIGFHSSNAVLQALAVICVLACYLFSRKRKFPEEEDDDNVVEE